MSDADVFPVDIVETKPLRVAGQQRWIGKAKFPKALRARAVVIFQFDDELIAIPSSCPHEQANLAQGRFVAPYVLECPLHQNTYDLRTGVIKAFKVEMEGERMYLLWRRSANEAVAPTFASTTAVEHRADDDRIRTLEAEVALLHEAADMRAKQVATTLEQMDGMIREVEERKNAFETANKSLAFANEFIGRVTDTMSEALVVCNVKGVIKDANKKLADLVGMSREAMKGQDVRQLIPDGDGLFQLLSSGSTGETELEACIKVPNGERA